MSIEMPVRCCIQAMAGLKTGNGFHLKSLLQQVDSLFFFLTGD